MKLHSNTDAGRAREENQDYVYTSENPVGNLSNLFIVADGMGGHNAGKYASSSVVDTVVESIQHSHKKQIFELFETAIQLANTHLMKNADDEVSKQGMGTTLVAATIEEDKLYVANVGDSRLYVVNSNEIRQITKDHSLVEEMIRLGQLDREKAKGHPDKNIITRAVGVTKELKIDYFEVTLCENDSVLICSDGLTNMVEDNQIKLIMNGQRDVVEKVERLIEEANNNGGKDNITVAVIEPY
ncbi:MAG: Stp1/IreP family PP2C-type Ser/Thr phosphatase [Lachnospiraceae bacterium]